MRVFWTEETNDDWGEKKCLACLPALYSSLYTDEHGAYRGLADVYEHKAIKHSVKEFVNEMAHTNGIESVWAVLKRGYNGEYHNWNKKHMRRYVNEFVFRLNEGNVRNHTMVRLDHIIRNAVGKRLTYKDLTAE